MYESWEFQIDYISHHKLIFGDIGYNFAGLQVHISIYIPVTQRVTVL